MMVDLLVFRLCLRAFCLLIVLIRWFFAGFVLTLEVTLCELFWVYGTCVFVIFGWFTDC